MFFFCWLFSVVGYIAKIGQNNILLSLYKYLTISFISKTYEVLHRWGLFGNANFCIEMYYQKLKLITFVECLNVKNQINTHKFFQNLLFIPFFMITFVKSLKKTCLHPILGCNNMKSGL